jgi:hypothetical protein
MGYHPSMTDPIAPKTPPDEGGKTRFDLSEDADWLNALQESVDPPLRELPRGLAESITRALVGAYDLGRRACEGAKSEEDEP